MASLLEKLEAIETKYKELESLIADPSVIADIDLCVIMRGGGRGIRISIRGGGSYNLHLHAEAEHGLKGVFERVRKFLHNYAALEIGRREKRCLVAVKAHRFKLAEPYVEDSFRGGLLKLLVDELPKLVE